MTELSFHRELYAGEAVDAAVKVYSGFATFELVEEPGRWVVRISGGERERLVARELQNYALGLTIQGRNRVR